MRRLTLRILSLTLLFGCFPLLAAPGQPVVPVEPGRPHAPSYDPHSQLSADKLLSVAIQHLAEGRTPQAIETLDRAIVRYPDDAKLYKVRGSIFLDQGRVAKGLEDVQRALSLAPNDVEVLTARASAYQAFGRGQEALADLDLALTLAPDAVGPRFNRGVLRVGTKDLDGALADFDYCIALDPHLAPPYFNRAMVYERLDRRAEAIADLERFIQIAGAPRWQAQARELIAAMREGRPLVPEEPVPSPHQAPPTTPPSATTVPDSNP